MSASGLRNGAPEGGSTWHELGGRSVGTKGGLKLDNAYYRPERVAALGLLRASMATFKNGPLHRYIRSQSSPGAD